MNIQKLKELIEAGGIDIGRYWISQDAFILLAIIAIERSGIDVNTLLDEKIGTRNDYR